MAIDARSEKNIATLLPPVQKVARAFLEIASAHSIAAVIISGLRTMEEQDRLYAQGRDTPGRVVTNARAGYSSHNFGIAFDVGVFRGPTYLPDSPLYTTLGHLGQFLGLEWGGTWRSFRDMPHYQLRPKWAKTIPERQMLEYFRAGRLFVSDNPSNKVD